MPESNKANTLIKLMVETLKLAPKLQLEGDLLTKDLGLTSSRWGVLGFLAAADKPLTVADLARRMDLKPQTVQRFVTALEEQGFLSLLENPDHKRAKLLRLSRKGEKALVKMQQREQQWASTLTQGMTNKDIAKATEILCQLQANINRS